MVIKCTQRLKVGSSGAEMGRRLCPVRGESVPLHSSNRSDSLLPAGPGSPCRLDVEQHHDWDATSIHSPPLQQLWLTAQLTLFNPRERAPRLSWEPMFLSEMLPLGSWRALTNSWYLWNTGDRGHCHFIVCTRWRMAYRWAAFQQGEFNRRRTSRVVPTFFLVGKAFKM